MPNNSKKRTKKELKTIVIIVIAVIVFGISIFMNFIGMRSAINHDLDSSGMAVLSVRSNKKDSLINTEEKKVDGDGKIEVTDILVNAYPIIKLNNSKWDRLDANFSGFKLDENGNATFEDGFTLYCNEKYVNYIVFNDAFKDEIIGHIKLGTDFKTIEKTLGEPTFRNSDYIGYKTREIYAFFYKNEVAIYPNRKFSNEEFEILLNSYAKKTYEQGRTNFLIEIRNKYKDFSIEKDEEKNIVNIKSTARQVIAKLDGLGNIEVEFYNGYYVALDSTKDLLESKIYIQNDKDLVELIEKERVSAK